MLTLEQFKASGIFKGDGDEASGLEGPGWVYADGSCCIQFDAQVCRPYLTIYNSVWGITTARTLEELAEILYVEFYIIECQP